MSLLMLRALLFAGECFLASLLLPVLAFAATALLRRRAALRHLIWTSLFGVLAVLPVVALLLPPRRIVEHVAAPVAGMAPVVAPVVMTTLAAAPAPPPSLALSLGGLFTLEHGVALLVVLWLAGLAWQMLRLGVGGLGLMRLRRASIPFAVAIESGGAVRLSSGEDGPSTFGILRPVILLPHSAQAWPAARLEAVLRHEAAHVRRRDTLTQFLVRLVCAVYWLNPLLWLAARQLRRDAEIAADDAVLAGGMMPSLYAAELVRLAAERQGVVPGVAMAGPPLAARVQSVLAENSSRKGVSKMDIAKTVTLGLAATLLLGAARFDIAVAQDAPMAPVAPVASPAEETIAAQARAAAARTERVKAQADRVAEQAKAKVEAETDPAKREQYRKDAEQVAMQSAKIKTQADRAAVQYAEQARQHMALAFQLAEEVRQKALADRARAEADRQRITLAEIVPPSGGHAESSASRYESVTINGATYNGNVELKQDRPGGAVTISADRMASARTEGGDSSQNKVMSRFSSTGDGVHIDAQVIDSADAVAQNHPEVAAAVTEAMRTAIAEASRKITAAVIEARAKAGLPPVLPVPPR